jgi:arabinose-5-phosphate isomerase
LLSSGGNINDVSLDQSMTRNPVTIASSLMAADALSLMQQHEITVLAVVNEQRDLVGILHLHDLLGKGEFRFLI